MENHLAGVNLEDTIEDLAVVLESYSNDGDFETGEGNDFYGSTRHGIHQWIRRKLTVAREGRAMATDELQRALGSIDELEDHEITSKARSHR